MLSPLCGRGWGLYLKEIQDDGASTEERDSGLWSVLTGIMVAVSPLLSLFEVALYHSSEIFMEPRSDYLSSLSCWVVEAQPNDHALNEMAQYIGLSWDFSTLLMLFWLNSQPSELLSCAHSASGLGMMGTTDLVPPFLVCTLSCHFGWLAWESSVAKLFVSTGSGVHHRPCVNPLDLGVNSSQGLSYWALWGLGTQC